MGLTLILTVCAYVCVECVVCGALGRQEGVLGMGHSISCIRELSFRGKRFSPIEWMIRIFWTAG